MIYLPYIINGGSINIPVYTGATLPATVTDGSIYALTTTAPGNIWYGVADSNIASGDIVITFDDVGPEIQVGGSLTVKISTVLQYNGTDYETLTAYVGVSGNWVLASLQIPASLDSATWEQVKFFGDRGKAPEFWKIGDKKTITLSDNSTVALEIIDFWHDEKTAGGKAPITFAREFATTTTGNRKMNATSTNIGGWENCEMRAYLRDTLFPMLPDDLRAVISPVNKVSSVGGGKSGLITLSETIFLPAATEYGANETYANYTDEGYGYARYAANNPGIFGNTSIVPMWTRTAYRDNTTSFCYKSQSGASYTPATNSYQQNWAFCV